MQPFPVTVGSDEGAHRPRPLRSSHNFLCRNIHSVESNMKKGEGAILILHSARCPSKYQERGRRKERRRTIRSSYPRVLLTAPPTIEIRFKFSREIVLELSDSCQDHLCIKLSEKFPFTLHYLIDLYFS